MTAIWAFFSTPLGRRIALIGGLLVGLWLLWVWHGSAKHDFWQASFDEGRRYEAAIWRDKLKATEDAARDTIRRREAAAYQRAVEDERARAAADAKDAQQAATIVERVIQISPSARDCTVDQATADALNKLRGEE